MTKYLIPVLFLFVGCGVTERVEVVHETAGCTSDVQCDDRDATSTDWCSIGSGICNHERTVVGGLCESAAGCDDGDPTSVDSCEAGVCNHSRDVTAPFDPSSPERQDALDICEMSLTCNPGDVPSISMPFTQCGIGRAAWSERGYLLWLEIPVLGTETTRLNIHPQMRVGNPSDRFRFSVRVDGFDSSPVSVRDMTGSDIERDGVTVEIHAPTEGWLVNYVFLTFDFIEDEPHSRALQWALPVGSVTNAETGTSYVGCMQVGPFVDVPEHGFLHLTHNAMTNEPLCSGTARVDSYAVGATLPDGLFRTESDSRLYFATSLGLPQRLIRFETLKEFIDWFKFSGATSWHPNNLCANTTVYPDAVLTHALETYEVETVGVRPGTPVSWYDYTDRLQHYGIADRNWTIRGIGIDPYVLLSGLECSWYDMIASVSSLGSDCFLDLSERVFRYTIVATDPATLDPQAISAASGNLYASYNGP